MANYNSRTDYDIIVVGAGPGGSLAAKSAAEKGARVLLMEKHAAVGYPLCCAEAISTTGLTACVPLNPRWIASKVERVVLIGPGGAKLFIQHPEAGFVLDRKIFDRDLASYAGVAGAEVKVNCQAVGLIPNNGTGYAGVRAVENDGEKEYKAKVIIGADGVESQVGRWAKMNTTLPLGGIDACAQYLLGGLDIPEDLLEFYFGKNVAPGGYIWVFPKGNGTANVGVGIMPSQVKGKTAKEFLDDFVSRRFPNAKILELMVGGVPMFRGRKFMQKDNILLVGDAARLVDSLSGGGIANAMLSGQVAGEVAAEFVQNGYRSFDYLKEYPQRFMKTKGRELRYYLYARHIFTKMKDDDLDFTLDFLNPLFDGQPVSALEPIKTIKQVLKKRPSLLLYARHIRW